ncbi:MAG: DUF1080 domain-containing protein [Planctomycetota bacterium]
MRLSALSSMLIVSAVTTMSFAGCGVQDVDHHQKTHQETNAKAETLANQQTSNRDAATRADHVEFVPPNLTSGEVEQGWVSLFDGKSLFGWTIPEGTNWRVDEGTIIADDGAQSLLLTPYELDDFELRCKFYLSAGGNSGLFLRTAANAKDPSQDTYELNICDSHPTHRTGSLVGRFVAENVPACEEAWHEFRVICEGPKIRVWLDGNQIVDFTDTSDHIRDSGFFGLQKNKGKAAYKDICIRPLKFHPLFTGMDTTGWQPVPGSKSDFSVKDGLLHVSNGPGFLQTNDTYEDFALKVTARINDEGLNSGVFFRALPGTEKAPSHGYEMQLHNGTKNGDRHQPADHGTGAIFRRVPARYVVANDQEFFTAVLIARKDQFATWVNGYQVVNWRDTRADHENPREGRKVGPGHISLQGHDPTTNLDFRSIEIHEFVRSSY